jgi:homoserine dehydrogenase
MSKTNRRPGIPVRRRTETPAHVGLIGYGTVGRAVARLLAEQGQGRVALRRVCARDGRPRPASLPAHVDWTHQFDDLLTPDIDIVVELVGGLEQARQWIRRALAAGKPVVTANKQVIAEHGEELLALARQAGRALRFEGAVGGGIPVIRGIEYGLAADALVAVAGILNGTCNYVLTRIESAGLPFEQAVTEAQAHGYAESDPSADIDGFDARAKLAILCQVGLRRRVSPSEIECRTISGTGPADFAAARAAGQTIRQVSRAVLQPDGTVQASVGPERVPLDSPLARVNGCENLVIATGRFGGDTSFAGRGAGGDATAVAVVSDLLSIARGLSTAPPLRAPRRRSTPTNSLALPSTAWPSESRIA